MELDWRLAGELIKHRKRVSIGTVEVIRFLFEKDIDMWTDE